MCTTNDKRFANIKPALNGSAALLLQLYDLDIAKLNRMIFAQQQM
jgi:hypothetical protein